MLLIRHVAVVLLLFSCLSAIRAQVSVLTHHNDNSRSGANLAETALNVSNVNRTSFGKLAFRIVDDNIYAQPLIVSGAKDHNGSTKTLAIVATENNTVYAFDAEDVDQNSTTAQVWKRPLGPAIHYTDLYAAIGAPACEDITTQIDLTARDRAMHLQVFSSRDLNTRATLHREYRPWSSQ